METTKIYLGLIAVWVMVAWMACEFAWDAWQNARQKRIQPPSQPAAPPSDSVQPMRRDDAGQANKSKLAV